MNRFYQLTPEQLGWFIVCSGLVFLMQPGFMCLETGLTRSKNNINVAVKNIADLGVSVTVFWMVGFGLMFGTSKDGWLGTDRFFLSSDHSPHLLTFFMFQAVFCSTATTIVSGAVAERMKFSLYLVVSFLVSVLIYPIFGHWAWYSRFKEGPGWLLGRGFVDFAGASVVHLTGASVALPGINNRPESRPFRQRWAC